MDGNYRLKIKVGPHEFDADGPHEQVRQQFEAFKEMVQLQEAVQVTHAHMQDERVEKIATTVAKPASTDVDGMLNKIMKIEGRVISLTARPKSGDDAVLLLLYAQKVMRESDSVAGAEIVAGIEATGGLQIARADRVIDKAASVGDVIVIGERRARRYRLTNAGLAKARSIATELLATVA